MAAKQSHRSETTGRIVLFPPRSSLRKGKARHPGAGKNHGEERAAIGDLSEYERSNQADDYPRRMIINAIAFAFILMLTIAGVWLAETMAMLQKNQDCALSGRRNCMDIGAELRDR